MNITFTSWHSMLIEEILSLNTLTLSLAQEIQVFDTKTINTLHIKSVASLLPDAYKPNQIYLNYSPYQRLTPAEQLLKNYINTLNYLLTTPNFKTNELALRAINIRLLAQLKPSWEAKLLSTPQSSPSIFLDKYVQDVSNKLSEITLPTVYRSIHYLSWLYNMINMLRSPKFIHLNTYMVLLTTILQFKNVTQLDVYTAKTFWNIYPNFLEYLIHNRLPQRPTATTLFYLKTLNSLTRQNLNNLKQFHKPIISVLATLKPRQRKLLRLLCRFSEQSIKNIQKQLKVSHMTIYRDLNKLNSLGLITVNEKNKRKRYRPLPIVCSQMDL